MNANLLLAIKCLAIRSFANLHLKLGGFAAKKEANPASLRSAAPSKGRGSRGYSLLPLEGGAPKGRRLEGESAIPDTLPSPLGEGAPQGRIG